MNVKKRNTAINIVCLIIIFTVIICTFVFKEQIEKFALTGYLGVFVACVASTATILIPAPAILVVIRYSEFLEPIIVCILGGLGTAIGEMLGFILGRSGQELTKIDKNKIKILRLISQKPYLSVFIFSLIPLPVFDIIGVCSGIIKTNPIKFFLSCFLGKTIKMVVYVILFKYAKSFINLV